MILFETPRLRVRRLEPADAARLAEYRSSPAIARYQSWETMTLEEAAAFIDAIPRHLLANPDEWGQLAIADKTTGALLGDIGLCRRSPDDFVELGVTLAPEVQGHGLAEEACRAVVEWVFSFPEVAGMTAVVDRRNTTAIALVQRLGMTFDHSETVEFKGAPCTEDHFVLRRVTTPASGS